MDGMTWGVLLAVVVAVGLVILVIIRTRARHASRAGERQAGAWFRARRALCGPDPQNRQGAPARPGSSGDVDGYRLENVSRKPMADGEVIMTWSTLRATTSTWPRRRRSP